MRQVEKGMVYGKKWSKEGNMSAAKQRVIDFRLRPPVDEFIPRFPKEIVTKKHEANCSRPTPSILRQSMDLLLEEMDDVGMRLGVINGIHWQDWEMSDEQVGRIQKKFPERLEALSTPDLAKPMKQIMRQIETSIRQYGFKGVAVQSYQHSPPMHVDDERLFPIYEKCMELGVFVQLLSGSISSCPDLTYTDPVHYQHVATRYPDLKILIAHACYPYITQVIALIANAVRMGKPNLFLEPDMYLFMPGGNMYVEAINAFPDQFVFASTYPFGDIKESIEKIKQLPIDRKARAKFLYDNAANLLKV
jgi:predicted TIM-barrel fold metal-dependent hydrolase